MNWMTTKDTADLWDISMRRVQALCENGKIEGSVLLGRMWLVPKDAPKPIDGRTKEGRKSKGKNIQANDDFK